MRYILSILAIILSIAVNAQNISVSDFRLDEMDLTANQQGSIVLDQNGEKCALIKVETTQTGFSFDVGSLGVQKTEQKSGEIWVYVPAGVRKMTISHPQIGILRDYPLPLTTQRAKTYILNLEIKKINTNSITPDNIFSIQQDALNGEAVAQLKLGAAYESGCGAIITKDLQKAVYWYTKAAEQGLALAQNFLGYCYDTGNGVEQDWNKAFYWFKKAADQDDAAGLWHIGIHLEFGKGVVQDAKKAFDCFLKSATKGNKYAQYDVGICYYKGKGVTINRQEAKFWLRKSAKQGYKKAKDFLNEHETEL